MEQRRSEKAGKAIRPSSKRRLGPPRDLSFLNPRSDCLTPLQRRVTGKSLRPIDAVFDAVGRQHDRHVERPDALIVAHSSSPRLFETHPFPYVGRAIHHAHALCLTRVQQPDAVDVDDVHFIQVQRYWAGSLSDLSPHVVQVRRSQLPSQTNSSPASIANSFDSQRHVGSHVRCQISGSESAAGSKQGEGHSHSLVASGFSADERLDFSGFPERWGKSAWLGLKPVFVDS